MSPRHDLCVCQCARQCQQARKHRAYPPSEFDSAGLDTLRPEEVEEESGSEDCGDVDADEDVEGGYADEIVVVDCGVWVEVANEGLLVDVVCLVLS